MKLTIFFLVVGMLNVAAEGLSQTVTFSGEKVPLKNVLSSVEKQTGFTFFYKQGLLDKSRPITIEATNIPLADFLSQVLKNQPLYYSIKKKNIIISMKPPTPGLNPGLSPEGFSPQLPPPIKISGTVVGVNNQPLVGANVVVKGTKKGTTTDATGNFSIEANKGDKLIITSIGYADREMIVSAAGEMIINLILASVELDEVVINKGYYTIKERINTGNISTVKSSDLEKQPVGDPLAALQGKVPGLFVQQTSGAPGRVFNIQLRGQNSLRENANAPLYIIDGIPFNSAPLNIVNTLPAGVAMASPLNDISLSDIESIDVLKDADATAIYGSRGANGVILITTKKGKAGKTSLGVNFYKGIGRVTRFMDLMNTEEYLSLRRQAFQNDNAIPGVADHDLNGNFDQNKYTDWQKVLIGGTAKITDVQVSLSGGNELTQFRFSGGYRTETTVYPTDIPNRKGNGQIALSHLSENRKLKLNFSANYVINSNRLPTADLAQSIFLAPNAPDVYLPDGNLNWANGTWVNPFSQIKQKYQESTTNLMVNSDMNYQILSKLSATVRFGYTKNSMESSNIRPFSSLNPTLSNPASRRLHQKGIATRNLWIIEPQLNYRTTFGIGIFDALVGTTLQESVEDRLYVSGNGFSNDALIDNLAIATTKNIGEDTKTEYRYNSVYGRLGYNIKDKYIVNLTGRRDGSSRFGPDRKFGNFGSIGAAWIFSEESFLSKLDRLSFGKIRVSYGITGNDQLEDYKYLSTYSGIINNLTYQGISGITATQHTNPSYSWEAVNKLELGLELGFFNDKYRINASWYQHKTSNQLVGYSLPDITGFPQVQANLPATIQNTGLELELVARPIKTKKINWTASTNISFPRNKLLAYPGIESSPYAKTYAIGYPLIARYRYRFTGIDAQTKQYTFEDVSKDGFITLDADRVPTKIDQYFFGGLNNMISYRNWQLDIMVTFAYQQAMNIYFNTHAGMYLAGKGNQPRSVLSKPDIQPYSQSFAGSFISKSLLFAESDGRIGDASYIRLKNVSLSYNVPFSSKVIKIIKNATIFAQVQNIFTITKYQGLDPENPFTSALGSLPPLRVLTFGINVKL